eukprot:CAMPEP_0196579636 /NCGR_PEP_ID=MMETSP1081-20130531/23832_1 /TAXON_ID=36882 /ORGANISM="Pyramimonas amylifera, Strain CCMP720" /LENGTH=361 /DNA_ID=CAMNT_0041899275 /DNA_START=255 /DNA_END=1340 /DNA_ORIENTATION=+
MMPRRNVMLTPLVAGIILPGLNFILPLLAHAEEEIPPPKNIIITGANSGIGFNGAAKLAAQGNTVYLACRSLAKAEAAKLKIEEQFAAAGTPLRGRLVPVECDLASIKSIRAFADSWKVSGEPLDVLVCNAGAQFSGQNDEVKRTEDGFEVTVGVNHLGHFLLTNLLLEELEKRPGGRVVVTASEVHDPSSPGGQVGPGGTLGDLGGMIANGKNFAMIDGGLYDAEKAYKDSKLCNILFARELQRRELSRGSGVTVNSFGPGLITRSGFFRNQKPLFVKVFDFAANDIFKVAETVDGGGDCLVYMATSSDLNRRGGLYFNNNLAGFGVHKFEEFEPSIEAQNAEEGKTLWAISEKFVGLNV